MRACGEQLALGVGRHMHSPGRSTSAAKKGWRAAACRREQAPPQETPRSSRWGGPHDKLGGAGAQRGRRGRAMSRRGGTAAAERASGGGAAVPASCSQQRRTRPIAGRSVRAALPMGSGLSAYRPDGAAGLHCAATGRAAASTDGGPRPDGGHGTVRPVREVARGGSGLDSPRPHREVGRPGWGPARAVVTFSDFSSFSICPVGFPLCGKPHPNVQE